MMPIIKAFLISLLPIAEVRGGIPFALASGVPFWLAFIVCVFANILVIPILYIFLNTLHKLFMHIPIYSKLFNRYIERSRHKLEKHIGTKAEFWFLMIFTGIPLPMTGAYTATILAWFFGIKKSKAFLAISLGVIIAAIIITLLSLGALEIIT